MTRQERLAHTHTHKDRERVEGGFYPVHFQQHARFPLGISEVGVGQAGAEAQQVSVEATGFLCLFRLVLHKVLSVLTLPVVLLLRVVVYCQAETGMSEERGGGGGGGAEGALLFRKFSSSLM